MKLLAAIALVSSPLFAAAWAADPETVTTLPGKNVRIGAYSVFRSNDCSAGPAPDIRIAQLPKNGVVTVQAGMLTTTRVPNCPKISGPVKRITYRPSPGFVGTDAISFSVVDTAGGKTDQHTVSIRVE